MGQGLDDQRSLNYSRWLPASFAGECPLAV